ncbi:hypothetical protein D9757_003672 [Collybiopsis confluens]|uniref:Lysophospholipase n=1 Tax=Collybiopsis confluens TaxID=2823264 RepID=A0A8H5HUN6_9AGAR|nr:hypothetical protein D9757_003672 [Collybiopsis confluens]
MALFLSLALNALLALESSASLTDYAPSFTTCPDTSLVRTFSAGQQALNPSESHFVSQREKQVISQNWRAWLGDGSAIGYDTYEFTDFARVGLAFSGGGYRASNFGAGVISAIDARNATSVSAGTGGLLQVASYLSGLSGGAWLTGSLYMNEFPTTQEMVLGTQPGWTADKDLLLPGSATNLTSAENLAYFENIDISIDSKAAAGFNITIGDGWARMLSYHFLNGTNDVSFFDTSSHGAGQSWSGIQTATFFKELQAPFPLVTIDTNGTFNTTTGTTVLDLNVWEVSPFEFASFDPDVSAGADLTYIGTSLFKGVPLNASSCVVGFDEAGFVIGTSSNIYWGVLASGDVQEVELLASIFGAPVNEETPAVAAVSKWPNPFQGIAPSTFVDSSSSELNLIDGGTNGENVPFNPLLVKAREIDVIVAVDASDDTNNSWPSGAALLLTAERGAAFLQETHQQLPEMPASVDDFAAQGLNLRPTFFGCDSTDAPLVIWLPNAPPLNGDAPFPTLQQNKSSSNETKRKSSSTKRTKIPSGVSFQTPTLLIQTGADACSAP